LKNDDKMASFAINSCEKKLRSKWPVEFGIHFQLSDRVSIDGHPRKKIAGTSEKFQRTR
jgi:hypothetical protein